MTDDTIESLRAEIARLKGERDGARASEASIRASAIRHDDANNETIRVLTKKHDAALATCAELRAALVALESCVVWSDSTQSFGLYQRVKGVLGPARALLARTDLGRGMVAVPRETLERWRVALDVAEERMCSVPPRGPGCVCRCPVVDGHTADCPISRARHDLDALLDGGKKGGG